MSWNHIRLLILVSLFFSGSVAGQIISVSFDDSVHYLYLTAAGTKDWAVFGKGYGVPKLDSFLDVRDFKQGGADIVKKLVVSGLTGAFGCDGTKETMWTGGLGME